MRTYFVVENAATSIAHFTSTASGYSRVTINAASNVDSQLSFQEATGTKWSIGNDAGTDSFIIRKGFGAFGTDNYLQVTTSGGTVLYPASGVGLTIARVSGSAGIKASSGDGYMIIDSAGNLAALNYYVSDNISLANGGGNVGVHTTSPQGDFDVYGTIASPPEIMMSNVGGTWAANDVVGKLVYYSRDASGIGAREVGKIESFTDTPGASAGFGLRFYVGPYNGTIVEALKILDDKNAYFTGSVFAVGECEAYDTSDMRYKDIIEPLDKELTARGVLGLSTFRYTQKGEERVRLGVSAQEIQSVFPENVKEDHEGKLMVHYGKMVPALIATIQKQQEEIDELKELVNGFRNK
jgi:hypothetical protein